MKFAEAMEEVLKGAMITKHDWGTNEIYGLLKDGFLMLRKEDRKYYQWIVSEGDMVGKDWIVLPEPKLN